MKTNSWCVALLALVLTVPVTARADVIDYAATADQLGTIDLQTGVFTPIGTRNVLACKAARTSPRISTTMCR